MPDATDTIAEPLPPPFTLIEQVLSGDSISWALTRACHQSMGRARRRISALGRDFVAVKSSSAIAAGSTAAPHQLNTAALGWSGTFVSLLLRAIPHSLNRQIINRCKRSNVRTAIANFPDSQGTEGVPTCL